MKESPIIFSTEMVRAILEGHKTMTRRVIKLQPSFYGRDVHWKGKLFAHEAGNWHKAISQFCPYGQVGSRLWVREAHKLTKIQLDGDDWIKCEYRSEYENDGAIRYFKWGDIPAKQQARLSRIRTWGKWRPARFMYRFLARTILEITEVRVEKLQEITEEDAKAEGICVIDNTTDSTYSPPNYPDIHRDIFIDLWDSLNAKRSFSWKSNPWVWVIEFKKLKNEH